MNTETSAPNLQVQNNQREQRLAKLQKLSEQLWNLQQGFMMSVPTNDQNIATSPPAQGAISPDIQIMLQSMAGQLANDVDLLAKLHTSINEKMFNDLSLQNREKVLSNLQNLAQMTL